MKQWNYVTEESLFRKRSFKCSENVNTIIAEELLGTSVFEQNVMTNDD
jgi:hypothetical protein